METREQTAAKNLKIAAIGYAVKHGDKRLERKLFSAAVKYAEERARMEAFKAELELGAVNAHESDLVMQGHPARAVPPGLTKAIRKVKRAERRRDLLAPRPKAPRLSTSRLDVWKMTRFQKEVLGAVDQYGHKPEDRREEKVLRLLVEHRLVEPCHGPKKRHYRLTEYGHEVWSVVSRSVVKDEDRVIEFQKETVVRGVTYPAGFWWRPLGSRAKFFGGPHRSAADAERAYLTWKSRSRR